MEKSKELIYGLNDRPPLQETLFAAVQHLLAIFVAIITPPAHHQLCAEVRFGDHWFSRFHVIVRFWYSNLHTMPSLWAGWCRAFVHPRHIVFFY